MGLILLIHRGRHFGRHTIWAVLKRQKEDFPVTLATFGKILLIFLVQSQGQTSVMALVGHIQV